MARLPVPLPFSRILAGWLLLCAFALAHGQNLVAIPPLTAHVTDQVGMLNASQRAALENVLTEYETRTGNQIAILLMDTTAPEVIEQYSIRVAEAWKLGRKGVDDGVLLVVAKNNPSGLRRLRIEAGRGVQGVVTDAQSKRILQDVIAPHFRQNDFYGGLAAGVAALTALLDQEHFPAPSARPGPQQQESGVDIGSYWPILLFLFLVIMMMRRSRGPRHYSMGRGWGRGSNGVILGGGLGGGLGGWGGGGWGGGSSSGGGGFSGGGGTFDGGGASGDW